jgi:hypothetical protein
MFGLIVIGVSILSLPERRTMRNIDTRAHQLRRSTGRMGGEVSWKFNGLNCFLSLQRGEVS